MDIATLVKVNTGRYSMWFTEKIVVMYIFMVMDYFADQIGPLCTFSGWKWNIIFLLDIHNMCFIILSIFLRMFNRTLKSVNKVACQLFKTRNWIRQKNPCMVKHFYLFLSNRAWTRVMLCGLWWTIVYVYCFTVSLATRALKFFKICSPRRGVSWAR